MEVEVWLERLERIETRERRRGGRCRRRRSKNEDEKEEEERNMKRSMKRKELHAFTLGRLFSSDFLYEVFRPCIARDAHSCGCIVSEARY